MEHTNTTTDPVLTNAAEIKAKLDALTTQESAEVAKVKAKFEEKRTKLQAQLKAVMSQLAERRRAEDELFRAAGVGTRERIVLDSDTKVQHDAMVLNAIAGGASKRSEIQAACADLSESHVSFSLQRLREAGRVATAGQKVAMRYFVAGTDQPSA